MLLRLLAANLVVMPRVVGRVYRQLLVVSVRAGLHLIVSDQRVAEVTSRDQVRYTIVLAMLLVGHVLRDFICRRVELVRAHREVINRCSVH